MAEFRTASALVNTTPFVRTASGLSKATAVFFGASGPIGGGGGEAPDLSAVANPAAVFGTGRAGTITTGATTATAAGGKAPFSYSWSLIDAIGVWEITAPTAATTAFRNTSVGQDDQQDATFACTITDANGKQASVNVAAQAYRYGSDNGQL